MFPGCRIARKRSVLDPGNWHREAALFVETRHVAGLHVQAYRHHLKFSSFECLLDDLHVRHLGSAWSTVCSPEIEEDQVTSEVTEDTFSPSRFGRVKSGAVLPARIRGVVFSHTGFENVSVGKTTSAQKDKRFDVHGRSFQ